MKVTKKIFLEKGWTLMKICASQCIIAMIFCGLSVAHSNYAQLLDKKISLSVSNVSFDQALAELEINANIKFAYSVDQVNVSGPVSLEVSNQSLRTILETLLTARNISYIVHEKKAVISLKKSLIQSAIPSISEEYDPSIPRFEVSGIVTDNNGSPMAGVNILIQGSTNGTTTDASGRYTISVTSGDRLVFSFIGFASQEVDVDNQTQVNVVLIEDMRNLSEVVVNAGYWEVKEKEQTGNIARVTSKQIGRQPVSNPLQAMQGRMAGVYIQQATGVPGGQISVQIRGQNSFRNSDRDNGNLPLYVIDGVPFTSSSLSSSFTSAIMMGGSPLNNISPSDIESIEVLKDADATAIYGSRGANGVVLIKTKRGSAGKTKFDFNIAQGFSRVARQMKLLNTQQYISMRKEAFRNDKAEPQDYDYDLMSWDTTRNTDWQKKLIGGTAHVTDAQTSISGGNTQTQFMFGGAYHSESSVFPGDFGYKKFSGNSSLVHTSANRKFSATLSNNYVYQLNELFSQDITANAMFTPPNAPEVYDSVGKLNWPTGFDNPYSYMLKKNSERTSNLISNVQLRYEILPGWSVKTSVGYTQMELKSHSVIPAASWNPAYGITNAKRGLRQ